MSDSNTNTNPNETANRLAAELAGAVHQIERLKAHAVQLSDELADANQQLQALKTEKEQALAADAQIAEKMRHGLTRDQAINVIKRQLDYDRQHQPQIRNPATP
jgi:uncharacterized coiled-coil DUF342 family protein